MWSISPVNLVPFFLFRSWSGTRYQNVCKKLLYEGVVRCCKITIPIQTELMPPFLFLFLFCTKYDCYRNIWLTTDIRKKGPFDPGAPILIMRCHGLCHFLWKSECIDDKTMLALVIYWQSLGISWLTGYYWYYAALRIPGIAMASNILSYPINQQERGTRHYQMGLLNIKS